MPILIADSEKTTVSINTSSDFVNYQFNISQSDVTFLNNGSYPIEVLINTVPIRTHIINAGMQIVLNDIEITGFSAKSISDSILQISSSPFENENPNIPERLNKFNATLNDMVTKRGDLNQLNTIDKSSIVNAIKEVKSQANTNTNAISNIGSATPKGVYATVSALTTAYPTGNGNIYVVTADGGWYYWSGSAWTKGGTYQSTGIANKSVIAGKIDNGAVTPSKIAFDDNLLNIGYQNGQYTAAGSSSYIASSNTFFSDEFALSSTDIIYLLDSNYKFNLVTFNDDGTVSNIGGTWITTTGKKALDVITNSPLNYNKLRIQLRRVDGANANASDIDFNKVILVKTNHLKIGTNELTPKSVTRDILADDIQIALGSAKVIDLFIFMGQSNMAGRGITSPTWTETAPTIIDGAGYEFRAITDTTKLYPMTEPFGINENKTGGINDGTMKTGSMVTAFTNAYYQNTKVPVVGVSASKGGSSISQWQTGSTEGYLNDAINRFNLAVTWLTNNGYTIRHKYMVWCQGETDGDLGTSSSTYKTLFESMLSTMISAGIEKMFMVRIGNCNASGGASRYTNMIQWQNDIAKTNENVVMVSCDFSGMRDRGLMKDDFHYYQAGYNECGKYAGVNSAIYASTGKEPTMYDSQDGTLYYSHKN